VAQAISHEMVAKRAGLRSDEGPHLGLGMQISAPNMVTMTTSAMKVWSLAGVTAKEGYELNPWRR
jgi:hypothetical protein